MPSKKHSRTNKKTKKSSKQHTSTGPGSTAEDIHQWIQSGRVNAKGLSRTLPDVAEGIRDGRIDPKQVPKMVQESNQDHVMAMLTKALGPGFAGMPITRLQSLEIMTNAEPLLCDLVRVACGSDEKLAHAFAHDFFHAEKRHEKWGTVRDTIHIMDGEQKISKVDNFDLIWEVQQAYDRTCDKWKHEIEKLAKKPLQEHVWAYKKHPAEFLAILGDLIHRNDNFSLEHIARDFAYTKSIDIDPKVASAVRGIENGWDLIRGQCWECGQVGQDIQVAKCSLCKAARYCSRECQRKSWTSGHKGDACAELKIMYRGFMANYLRINHALKLRNEQNATPMCEGCPLAPAGAKDYVLLPMLLSNWTFPVVLYVDIARDGCTSIDHMYKSLADIVRGRTHWMFEDTFEGTLQEYIDTTVLERADNVEMDYMLQGLLFLTLAFSKLPSSSSDVPTIVNLFKQQLRKSSMNGELMQAKRFIAIYYRFGLGEQEGHEDASARWKYMAQCMGLMMKHFHKKNGPLDVPALLQTISELRGRQII